MIDLDELRQALAQSDLDGWLLYDFHGLNPVAGRVLGLTGMNTRRLFVLLPRAGEPVRGGKLERLGQFQHGRSSANKGDRGEGGIAQLHGGKTQIPAESGGDLAEGGHQGLIRFVE